MGVIGRGTGNRPYDVYDKAETVSKAGVETITGQKTFTTPVKVADATLADEALSKGQLLTEIKAVDGHLSGLDADTVDGVQGALLGVGGAGYAWVDETANITAGTTYTNTKGKPILINCIGHSTANCSGNIITIFVNGNTVAIATPYCFSAITAIVGSGDTYACTLQANVSIYKIYILE